MRVGSPSVQSVNLLTVAVLLAALVWTQIADRPMLSSEAQAAPPPKGYVGFPVNAGAQRLEIIKRLDELNESMATTRTLLESGDVKVTVVDPSARVTRRR